MVRPRSRILSIAELSKALADRFVYWPATRHWARAFGGPPVPRETVAKALQVCPTNLAAYEQQIREDNGDD